MPRKLKVFGTMLWVRECPPGRNGSHQTRCIVATTSQKQAAAAFDISLGELRNYGSETGNQKEIETALADPGTVFWSNPDTDEYVPMKAGR